MLSVEKYRQNGYLVVKGLLDVTELVEVKRYLESRISQEVAAACEEIGCHNPADIVSYIGRQADSSGAGLTKGTRDTLSGHFSLEARLSRELWRVPRSPRLQQVLQDVLGGQSLYMHMPPTARFVLPGNVYAGVPAHQDVGYNRHMTNFVTVWVPFVTIDSECGGVKVFKGSNKGIDFLNSEEKEKFWLKSVPSGDYEAEHCEMQVGDVLILSKWILHESMPNLSSKTRISTDFRFFPESERSTKHFLDMQSWKVIEPGVAS
jgi:ectoine hydroxylase-related dioxygenase (phytanoyl-CoA dioxygenase family)